MSAYFYTGGVAEGDATGGAGETQSKPDGIVGEGDAEQVSDRMGLDYGMAHADTSFMIFAVTFVMLQTPGTYVYMAILYFINRQK